MTEPTIFLITPIGAEGSEIRARSDDVLEFIVSPAAREFNLPVMRSDLDPTPGQVTSRLLRSILEARVVIADLTGRNPNVYYELGVVHSFAKPVVIMVDKASSLTFDTQNEGVIQIGDDGKIGAAEAEEATTKLTAALRIVLARGYRPSSIVTEVAGAQSLSALAPDNPIASELAGIGYKVDFILDRVTSATMFSGSEDHSVPLSPRVLLLPIEHLDLTVRTYNILKREGIHTIADLAAQTEAELATFRNFGSGQLREVKVKLNHLGFELLPPHSPPS